MEFSKITKNQAFKILKTALYVGISAILGWAIAGINQHPEMFGVYAPVINVILVTIKQLMTKENL